MSKARELANLGNAYSDGALSNRNKILNGAMQVAQRGVGPYTQTAANQYGLDRFDGTGTVTSKFSFEQSSVAPAGFVNSTLITSLSAYSVLTGDFFVYRQRIEGLNCSDLSWGTASAKTVTLSFWVRSSLTGTFGGYFANSAFNRSFPFSFTISSANTWEYKSVTVLGDTSGTWLTTNGVGIEVGFSLGAGATYSGPVDTWAGSFYTQPTSSTSVVATNGATFYITGVQLEVGDTATPFEHRSYGQELALCQRYYIENIRAGAGGYASSAGQTARCNGNFSYPTTMRAAPTVTVTTLSKGNVDGDVTATDIEASCTACGATATASGSMYWKADFEMDAEL